jgi:hypothetical protein
MFTSAQFCQICACCYIHPNAAGGTESAGLVQTTNGSIHRGAQHTGAFSYDP